MARRSEEIVKEDDKIIETSEVKEDAIEGNLGTVTISVKDLEELIKNEVDKKLAKASEPVINAVPSEVVENESKMHELVPVKLFYDGEKYTEPVSVTCNGITWMIKRGEEVMIPRYIKEILDNSMAQDEATARYCKELEDDFEKKSAEIIN